jgi:hypothetical protein
MQSHKPAVNIEMRLESCTGGIRTSSVERVHTIQHMGQERWLLALEAFVILRFAVGFYIFIGRFIKRFRGSVAVSLGRRQL